MSAITPDAAEIDIAALLMKMLAIEAVSGTEEATNAGIPSAAATLFLGRTGIIRFKGSTPLGTSAGVDEAIHYVDSIITAGELTKKYPDLFKARRRRHIPLQERPSTLPLSRPRTMRSCWTVGGRPDATTAKAAWRPSSTSKPCWPRPSREEGLHNSAACSMSTESCSRLESEQAAAAGMITKEAAVRG